MSFTQRAKTPKSAKIKFLTEYPDYYNTFNKAKFSYFRDKIKKNEYKQNYNNYGTNQYKLNTFYKSSTPFNYIINKHDKDGLLVYYNGGPRKQFHPLLTKDNLNQILKNRRSISTRYKRPCGCYSNYNITKYSQEYIYPNYERNEHFYKSNNLPYIGDNDNSRYINQSRFISPQIANRKITNKLKDDDNYNNSKYRINTETNNYKNNKILQSEKNEEIENENKAEAHEEKIEEKKEEIKDEEKEKNKKSFNYFNLKPRRRFHKIQIFNNCKPFLVDDFKDYGYYE